MDLIRLYIKGISYSQNQTGAYALILEEEFGSKKLPVIIGSFEAQAIALALEKDIQPPRPLTHDLFTAFAENFHFHVKAVYIHKLLDGVFYSSILCSNDLNEEKEIDSRTSDAVAIALRFNAPIYATKEVMTQAGIEIEIEKSPDETDGESPDIIETDLSHSPKAYAEAFTDKDTEELKTMMSDAIKNEEYEMAARLRDEIEKRQKK